MKLLYEQESYQIRGACFSVQNALGSKMKEIIYHRALKHELAKRNLSIQSEPTLHVQYDGQRIGTYRPDFIIDDKILLEIKAIPYLTEEYKNQFWRYLRGTECKLGFLVNFGGSELEIHRRVYERARNLRTSAPYPR